MLKPFAVKLSSRKRNQAKKDEAYIKKVAPAGAFHLLVQPFSIHYYI